LCNVSIIVRGLASASARSRAMASGELLNHLRRFFLDEARKYGGEA
jgi:hypothetical protein